MLAEDAVLTVRGRVRRRDDTLQVHALEVSQPDVTAVEDHPMTISMPVTRCTPPVVERLREILAEHPGVTDVHLRLTQPGRSTVMRLDNGSADREEPGPVRRPQGAARSRLPGLRPGSLGSSRDPSDPEQQVFLTERHLATLTTLRPDGTPHVVPVAAIWDAATGRLLDHHAGRLGQGAQRRGGGRRARARGLCQVNGGRWLTLEGVATIIRDPADVADAERRHASCATTRSSPDPRRVVLAIAVDRVMGSDYMAL